MNAHTESTRDAWRGRLSGLRTNLADVRLRAMPEPSAYTGESGVFVGIGDDRQTYWIKPLNNPQAERVPIVEQIVGRLGRLLGQTFCTVRTIEIPQTFLAKPYCLSRALQPGIAHASLNVDGGEQIEHLVNRRRDDNRRNHAAILAMGDLCWGRDEQWLIDAKADERYYSHDHGLYLNPPSPWGTEEFERLALEPHRFPDDWKDIDNGTAVSVVTDLKRMTMATITEVLRCIPATWPVSDEQLESIGYFLEVRAPSVARRILDAKGLLL